MHIARRMRAAAGALAALVLCGFAATGPVSADTAQRPVSPALTPQDGSTNVRTTGDRLTLGDAGASRSAADVARRSGYALLAPVTLPRKASAVSVDYAAKEPAGSSVAVDVRARARDGAWTQWTTAAPGKATDLPVSTRTVELRVALQAADAGAAPSVGDVTVAAAKATKRAVARAAAPVASRVFATREGLVGGTTANGHVIVERDHFIALPSRRGLSAAGTGDYSVQVCANGRCVWEPVWDVGPWNTKDDYWSPSATREMWQDLPQGKPEAQAAYEDGYNGGRDQFGRDVANPAGIDLADGTFWDGLGMTDNGWVDVVYQWTGDGTYGSVELDGGYLNVRNDAGAGGAVVGMAGDSARVPLQCQVQGDSVTGSQGTTATWYRVNAGMYLSKAWVAGGDVAAC